MAPRGPPRPPRGPQESPKRAPKTTPRRPREGPRSPASPLGVGGLERCFFHLPLFPFGEGFPLPPYPLSWTWTGRFARCEGVLFGSRWLQEGLREPKMTSKMAQDSRRWLKLASDVLEEVPRPLQDVSRWPQILPQEAAKMRKSLKHLKRINEFCLLAYSLSSVFRGFKAAPRWPKRAPKGA